LIEYITARDILGLEFYGRQGLIDVGETRTDTYQSLRIISNFKFLCGFGV
jgi:hypothetical protein